VDISALFAAELSVVAYEPIITARVVGLAIDRWLFCMMIDSMRISIMHE